MGRPWGSTQKRRLGRPGKQQLWTAEKKLNPTQKIKH